MSAERSLVSREAAVLAGKAKVGIGEESVEHGQHLAHDGDEADPGGFAASAQPLVKLPEDGVRADGGDCRHVEHMANRTAAAADVAWHAGVAAVAGVRRQAHERGDRGIGQGAEFRHVAEQRGGEDRTDTLELLEPRTFLAQCRLLVEVAGDRRIDRGAFLGQEALLALEPALERGPGGGQLVLHFDEPADQVAAELR